MSDLILKKVIDGIGGVSSAASVCGISPRAIYKWLKAERLPRTDYTGETHYAELLTAEARKKGIDISPDVLLKKAA